VEIKLEELQNNTRPAQRKKSVLLLSFIKLKISLCQIYPHKALSDVTNPSGCPKTILKANS